MKRLLILLSVILSTSVHAVTVLKCDVGITEGVIGTVDVKSVLTGEATVMDYPDHFAIKVLHINQETPPLEVHVITDIKNVRRIVHRITIGDYVYTRANPDTGNHYAIQDIKNKIRYLITNCTEVKS
ncbi:TPA: hypothetical protein M7920_003444 [Citrobacter freundii]|nr:hypothetical protein [Citrobacter freundii]